MNYQIDIQSLHKHFPPSFEVPTLLIDFAKWLNDKRAGSLGFFSLRSDRFDDFWIENGTDLHPDFAFFMCDPTGGRIGYWRYPGCPQDCAPIVQVGSEGELNIISNSLHEFLKRLSDGKTEVPDLDSHEDGEQEEMDLTDWLDSHAISKPLQKRSDHPNLERWMENWGQQKRDWIDNDTHHRLIAAKLRKYVEPNAQPWEVANFDAVLVGSEFKIWHRSYGPKPMPDAEIAELRDLFVSVRTRRALEVPERGLWFSAWVKVGSTGAAVLCCNFLDLPKILDKSIVIPVSEYQKDLSAFPRSKHWTPEWI